MVIVNQEGQILLVNSQTEKLFGYAREELLGQTVEMLVPERFRAQASAATARATSAIRGCAPMGAGSTCTACARTAASSRSRSASARSRPKTAVLVSSSIRDVTERKRFERTLQEKNLELENANLAKDRFLASMSHELRTPLNAIIGFTGTLLMKLPGPLPPDQERQLRTVQSSARHLLSLINDLLDLAKIESGKVELNLEPVECQRGRGRGGRGAAAGGRSQGAGVSGKRRRRRPGGPGGPPRPQPDPAQPHQQRHQVHREGPRIDPGGEATWTVRTGSLPYLRHRGRDSRGGPGQAVPGVRAGGRRPAGAGRKGPAWACTSAGSSPNCSAVTSPCESEYGKGSTFTLVLDRRQA